MDNNFDILIPEQEKQVAIKLIEIATSVFGLSAEANHRIAKENARAKYWEAYDCGDLARQEYWRIVMITFDIIETPQP